MARLEGKNSSLPRRVHRVTDHLSSLGWELMLREFRAGTAFQAIAAKIAEATGEQVSARTIARRCAEWRMHERRVQALASPNEGMTAALDHLDTRCGWYLRRRKSLLAAVDRFLRDPNPATIRPVKDELLLFWVEYRISLPEGELQDRGRPDGLEASGATK